jgi:uncharacterized protein YecT (DUF1311 family)
VRRLLLTVVIVAALVVGGSIIYAYRNPSSKSTDASTSLDALLTNLVPPVLKEGFTVLSCSRLTTIGLEGCAEHRILSVDMRINALRRQVFQYLYDNVARRDFIAAENDWFTYRQATCTSESEVNEGGSLVPVDFANCVVRLDRQHLAELVTLRSSYEPVG